MPGAREEKGALSPEQLTSIELTESSSGTRLRLRVKPGARNNTVLSPPLIMQPEHITELADVLRAAIDAAAD